MKRYGIDWQKKDTHNKHLSVLDYKKQERAKEVAALEEKIKEKDTIVELRKERIANLEGEFKRKSTEFEFKQYEINKKLDETLAVNKKLEKEGIDLRIKNLRLKTEYYTEENKLEDKKQEIANVEKEADNWKEILHVAKWEVEQAQEELNEVKKLRQELLKVDDVDIYLKEQILELQYQNGLLQEENRTLKDRQEKAYEFMQQFVIDGMNLLEKFKEWIGEKVRKVGRRDIR